MSTFSICQPAHLATVPRGAQQAYGLAMHCDPEGLSWHYEIGCCIQTTGEPGGLRLSLHRGPVYINGEPPEDKAYRLAAVLAAPFFPIVIEQAGAGAPLQLVNHEDIRRRCRAAEEDARAQFDGPATEACLATFRKAASNPATILRMLETDAAVQLLFAVLPERPGADAGPGVRMAIAPYGAFTLVRTAADVDDTFLGERGKYAEFAGPGSAPDSSLSLRYRLHPTGTMIRSVAGTLHYTDAAGRPAVLRIELYHLNAEGVPAAYKAVPQKREEARQAPSLIVSGEERPSDKRSGGGWRPLF